MTDAASQGFFGPDEILAAGCHAAVGELVNYWRSIHPLKGLPSRTQVDAAKIPHLLNHLWMLDVEAGTPPRFRFRLISSKNSAVIGHGMTGRYLDIIVPQFATTATYAALCAVVEKRLPHWRRGKPDMPQIEEFLQLERVLLPLASDSSAVDVIVALTIFYRRDGSQL